MITVLSISLFDNDIIMQIKCDNSIFHMIMRFFFYAFQPNNRLMRSAFDFHSFIIFRTNLCNISHKASNTKI